jgi:tRNA A37 threonylcarbamoyladenosine synthetase subunit TsaC/SUA5/YrdC
VPLALVRALGHPIISTSANRSQQEVLTDLRELEATLGRQVDLILECGLLSGVASSVISLIDDQVEILREGQGDVSFFREQP